MTTLQMLTLRRNAALARLATLQRRAERLTSPASGVVTNALGELTAALEEMQVATEQLHITVEELAGARVQLQQVQQNFMAFMDILPSPCVWTNAAGDIELANSAAAELLNVSAGRLAGRPLMLFVTDRQAFVDALAALNDGLTAVVEVPVVVRPRERRPRSVRLVGRRLPNDPRHCWFLSMTGPASDGLREPSEPGPDL